MPFTDHTIELVGCRTHYRRGGKGIPLIFLHGASGAPVVLPFMEKLAERFDVIVPDHPGYGQSDEPAWLENIHDVGYFYLDFLAALKLERAVIVGSTTRISRSGCIVSMCLWRSSGARTTRSCPSVSRMN